MSAPLAHPDALAAVLELNRTDPLYDERLWLAVNDLPPLADDDPEED